MLSVIERCACGLALLAVSTTAGNAGQSGDPARQELCNATRGLPVIMVAEHFALRNNKWGKREASGCIYSEPDGRFGWTWNREASQPTNYQPNFPDVMWGEVLDYPDSSTTRLLPIRIGDIESLTGRIDAETTIMAPGFKYNSNIEIWTSRTHDMHKTEQTHEIMIMFDWKDDPTPPIEARALTSGGRSFDYHKRIDEQAATRHTFHIFHQNGSRAWPDREIDLRPFFDYLIAKTRTNDKPLTADHWLADVMVGNEVWDNSRGETQVRHIHWSLNGQTEWAGMRLGSP